MRMKVVYHSSSLREKPYPLYILKFEFPFISLPESNSYNSSLEFKSGFNTQSPILSRFPSFSFPDVLCDPADVILEKGPHLKQ